MSEITEDDEFIITMFDYDTGNWYYLSTSDTLQKSLCDYKSGGDAYVLKYQTTNSMYGDDKLAVYIRNGNNSLYMPVVELDEYYFPVFSLSQDVSVQKDGNDYAWYFNQASTIALPVVSIFSSNAVSSIFFNTDYILTKGPNFTLYQNKIENYYGIIRLQPKNFDPSKWDGTPIPLPQMNVLDSGGGFGNAPAPKYNPGKYFDTTPLVPFTCKDNGDNGDSRNKWIIIVGVIVIAVGMLLVVVGVLYYKNKKEKDKAIDNKEKTNVL